MGYKVDIEIIKNKTKSIDELTKYDNTYIKNIKYTGSDLVLRGMERYLTYDGYGLNIMEEVQGDRRLIQRCIKQPIVLGRDTVSGELIIADFKKETGMFIFGQSGSGKTSKLVTMMSQLFNSTSPLELQCIIFDNKGSSILNGTLTRYPHVLSYETNVNNFIKILDGLKLELSKRVRLVQENNYTSWESFKENNPNTQKLSQEYADIIVVFEEYLSTISNYGELGSEINKIIKIIGEYGYKYGIKFVGVSQRVTVDVEPIQNISSVNIMCKQRIRGTFEDEKIYSMFNIKKEEISNLLNNIKTLTNFITSGNTVNTNNIINTVEYGNENFEEQESILMDTIILMGEDSYRRTEGIYVDLNEIPYSDWLQPYYTRKNTYEYK